MVWLLLCSYHVLSGMKGEGEPQLSSELWDPELGAALCAGSGVWNASVRKCRTTNVVICHSSGCLNKWFLRKLLTKTFKTLLYFHHLCRNRTCLVAWLVTYDKLKWLVQGRVEFAARAVYKPWPWILLAAAGLWCSGWEFAGPSGQW